MRFRLKKTLRNENGAALVIVLLIATIAMIIGLSSAQMALSNTKFNAKERQYQAVYYIAESGITYAKNEIQHIVSRYQDVKDKTTYFQSIESEVMTLNGKDYKDFEPSFGEKPKAKIDMVLVDENDDDNMREYKVISTGYIGEHTYRKVEQTVRIFWNDQSKQIHLPQSMTVFANGTIDLSGGASIKGDAGTNLSGSKSIILDGGASISGDIYVGENGGSSSIDVPDWYNLTNKIIPLQETVILNRPEFPSYPTYDLAEDTKIQDGNYVIKNGNLSIEQYWADNYTLQLDRDMAFNSISLSSNYTLYIDVGNSDRSIVVNDLDIKNGHIVLKGTGKLTIYIRDEFNMGAGSTINDSKSVDKLQVYYKGASLKLDGAQKIFGTLFAENTDIIMSGGSGFIGTIITLGDNFKISGGNSTISQLIYAPYADVEMSGGGTIIGTIFCKTFKATGGATVIHGKNEFPNLPGGDLQENNDSGTDWEFSPIKEIKNQ